MRLVHAQRIQQFHDIAAEALDRQPALSGDLRQAVATHIPAHHTILRRQDWHPGNHTVHAAHRRMQQQHGVVRLPGRREIVDGVVDADAVAGGEIQ